MAEPNICLSSRGSHDKKIVIIGAGIAGLACGSHLKELGFTDVTILEARDRIGGRIHTEYFGKYFIEIGAQWIHGEKNNSIYDIAQKNDLVDTSTTYTEDLMCFNSLNTGEKEAVETLISYLEEKINTISDNSKSFSSIQDFLDHSFQDYIQKLSSNELVNCLNVAYEWFCKFLCEHNGCGSLTELSVPLFNNYEDCDGNPTCELKYGFSSILKTVLNTIPTHWILKNKIVSKINWCEFKNEESLNSSSNNSCSKYTKRVKVLCTDGDIYFAHHVVVTLPLGYLKKHAQTLFEPQLSDVKLRAIRTLGFGILNKVYLEFEEPFWKASDVFHVLWNKSYDEIFTKESPENKPLSQVWTQHINRFAYTLSHPKMLCAWVTSEGAIQVESLSEKEIVDGCMTLLETLMGKKLPLPCKVLKSTWMSDPFSCGSYSYLSTECEKENVSNSVLAEPEYSTVHNFKYPVLLFAGEASHECYFSTVHGAYDTGIREADRIFRISEFENLKGSFEDTTSPQVKENNILENLNVIIIGAGVSGLTCAMQLARNGFKKVSILEAQGKIGGRICSVSLDNEIIELGAQWIHGTGNELFKFSNQSNLLQPSFHKPAVEGQGVFCTSDGCVVSADLVAEVKDVLSKAKIELEKGNYEKKIRKSVLTFLSEAFESHIKKSTNEEENLLKRSVFDWYIKFEVIDNGCDNLNDIAIQSFTEWDDCPEDLYYIEYKRGCSSVIDVLKSKIQNESISLNKPIETIKWEADFELSGESIQKSPRESFPVTLKCKNGGEFYADTVIVTSSAGFLKENLHTFFEPSLPENKVNALNKIGFGTINKIFLKFDEPFWSSEDSGFQLVWTKGCKKTEQFLTNNPWVSGITGFDVVKNVSNVLLVWIGGEEAKLMEEVSEESVKVTCAELLRMFLKCPDIPIPSKVLRSCWFSNPYVKGAYSNRTTDYYQSDSNLYHLQHPLCAKYVTIEGKEMQWPIVMFAGEALDEVSFSSVHGAFRSGLKAANYLFHTSMEAMGAASMNHNF